MSSSFAHHATDEFGLGQLGIDPLTQDLVDEFHARRAPGLTDGVQHIHDLACALSSQFYRGVFLGHLRLNKRPEGDTMHASPLIARSLELRERSARLLSGRRGLLQVVTQQAQLAKARVFNLPAHELRNPRVADAGSVCDSPPVATAGLQQVADFGVKRLHGSIIAKLCGNSKQHFATPVWPNDDMGNKPINVVLAEALAYFMGDRWTNSSLGRAAGVAPNTVRNYLNPEVRDIGSSGKEPSAKLTELSKLADALGVQVGDLVTDATVEERERIYRKRVGEYVMEYGVLPAWAPPVPEVHPEHQRQLMSTGRGELSSRKVDAKTWKTPQRSAKKRVK